MNRERNCRGGLLGLALVLAVAACRATPVPVPFLDDLAAPRGLVLRSGHYAGTSISGPTRGAGISDVEVDLARVYDLEVTALLVRRAPEELRLGAPAALRPLVGAFDVAMSLDRRAAVETTPRLFEGALIASGDAAREYFESLAGDAASQVSELFATDTVLGAGMTFELEAGLSERVEDPDNFLGEFPRRGLIPKGARLALHATAGNDPTRPLVGWGIGLAGALPLHRDARLAPEEERFRPGSPAPATELVRPERRPVADEPLLVILRTPFDASVGRSLVFFVELSVPPVVGGEAVAAAPEQPEQPEQPDASMESGAPPAVSAEDHRRAQLAQALTSIEARRAATNQLLAGEPLGDFLARTVPEAYDRLEKLLVAGAELRPALLFLAGALDAPMSMDALLALRQPELAALTKHLLDDRKTRARDPLWSLERWSWKAVRVGATGGMLAGPGAQEAAASDRGAGELAALEGLLLRHAGEVGRYPNLLEEALVVSPDLPAFAARLVAENRVFLEDSNPASRVRAFDWLRARSATPPLYEPLAARPARRAALEAEAAAAVAPTPAVKPVTKPSGVQP